ncbi:hypothetical protein Tco_0030588, partial [Tanacetum coccineum]
QTHPWCYEGGCDDDDGGMMMVVAAGGGGGEWRVRESDGGDRIDRSDGESFGLRRKNPPEKFSGGGTPVAAGRRRWWRGREFV